MSGIGIAKKKDVGHFKTKLLNPEEENLEAVLESRVIRKGVVDRNVKSKEVFKVMKGTQQIKGKK